MKRCEILMYQSFQAIRNFPPIIIRKKHFHQTEFFLVKNFRFSSSKSTKAQKNVNNFYIKFF